MAWPFTRRETKEHPNGGAFMVNVASGWAPPKKTEYASEGYQLNVIVYRAIQEIVKAATSIGIELYQGDKLVEKHPALDLIKRPTPMLTWDAWLSQMMIDRMLCGEMACAADTDGKPSEIWPINPMQVTVKPGPGGMPSEYVHEVNGHKKQFPVDRVDGNSQLMFVKTYNPLDYWRGQSPLMAAALSADTHNAGVKWNYGLLKNSARPSGLLKFLGNPSSEVVARLREFIAGRNQGPDNAGSIAYTDAQFDWVELSKTAKDMDFHQTLKETAKYIASALGVPLPLIDNDASTFNNLEQAKERLYTDTVIPLVQELLESLSNWLLPRYGKGFEFRIDMDSIPALEGLRERKFQRASVAYEKGILSLEEAREMMGYPRKVDGVLKSDFMADIPPVDAKALAYGLDGKGLA